jgi:hypothetical protein
MSDKIIIHIGYHKTGTTFLNNKFFSCHPEINHKGKPYSLDDPVREFIERIMNFKSFNLKRCVYLYNEFIQNKNQRTVVTISDGRIIGQTYDSRESIVPERLRSISENFKVIVVLRNQIDYLSSIFIQHVGTKKTDKSFDEWFDMNWNEGVRLSSTIDYCSRISPYIDILGRDNVMVLLYEELRENPNVFEKRICDFIGVSNDSFNIKNNKNASNKRMTVFHYFIMRHPLLLSIAEPISRFVPKNIKSYVLSKFNKANPELSLDRKNMVLDLASSSNSMLVKKINLPLTRFEYPLE